MKTKLEELFASERAVRRLHAELADEGKGLLSALSTETRQALAEGDTEEAALRLVRLAALLGELEGPEAADLLIDILGGASAEARAVAGEELENLAFDRFKEVALAIERALVRLPGDSAALTELPYLLAEVGEPGCLKLLGRFLAHKSAEPVAAAIEALAELGDPAGAALLAPLERDGRHVEVDDDGGGLLVTVGELAHEARELLGELEERTDPAPKPKKK